MKYLRSLTTPEVIEIMKKIRFNDNPELDNLVSALQNGVINKDEYQWLLNNKFQFIYGGEETIFASWNDGTGIWFELE